MITLCMDTSTKYLVLGLIRDHELIASVVKDCWKRQSEEIFPCLEEMMNSVSLSSDDIDQVVITEGPGSYTGVRIAMTVAKVFCVMGNKSLYTIGTLQLMAGRQYCRAVLDARGSRVYTAVLQDGKYVEEPCVKSCEEVKALNEDVVVIGDGSLVGKEDNWQNLAENFLALEDSWVLAENANLVTPEYLKSSEAYFVK